MLVPCCRCDGSQSLERYLSGHLTCKRCCKPFEDERRAAARYFISEYTDGPATRWNVIDRQTQEWVRRFPTESEAQAHADKLNA